MNENVPDNDFDDDRWMRLAIELSLRCPQRETAYSVGAVIVGSDGEEISRGFSRETDEKVHAEESALLKVGLDDPRLRRATIYSTLEPCSRRASRPRACAQLILDAGIRASSSRGGNRSCSWPMRREQSYSLRQALW